MASIATTAGAAAAGGGGGGGFAHGAPSGRGLGMENLLLLTDSYKVSHHVQYPPGTTTIYSYFESRGGLHAEICFFGLQYFLKRYLCGAVVTAAKIAEARAVYEMHFGPGTNVFNEAGWQYVLEEHGGVLPVRIKAVPEGYCLPYKNCCMTVENTDPKCFWLVNFLETLLVQVWYPMTVATNSREQKKGLLHFLRMTGDPAQVDFKLHDFGFRGVSSVETAGIGACAHLTQFLGTDTIAGLVAARDYYGAGCAGFSIPASEHSTMTSWGRDAGDGPGTAGGELAACKNMLEQYPKGLMACVSDSYDIWNCVDNIWGGALKAQVRADRARSAVVWMAAPLRFLCVFVRACVIHWLTDHSFFYIFPTTCFPPPPFPVLPSPHVHTPVTHTQTTDAFALLLDATAGAVPRRDAGSAPGLGPTRADRLGSPPAAGRGARAGDQQKGVF
jgi:nicotinic acid phosphoribosyltransferase